jgi:hypothetical protein
MTRYPLEHIGNLLVTKAAVSGPAGVKVVRLLVDTGSVYTILPVEVLRRRDRLPMSPQPWVTKHPLVFGKIDSPFLHFRHCSFSPFILFRFVASGTRRGGDACLSLVCFS